MKPSANLSTMLARGRGHVHFVGIGGVGMAGVAALLQARGFRVTGCDAAHNRLVDWLERRGIAVSVGHSADHIGPDVDWVVRTAAIPADAEEPARALARGLPVFPRGAVLPQLLPGRTSVAVCGTHGKTTTSTFIAVLLQQAGRDPAWCIGGESELLGGVAGTGAGALVVEADESDGTLALYRPDITVVTNIEFDHMEHFASVEDFEECFRTAVRHTSRKTVYCADDPRAARLCATAAHALPYGFAAGARLTAGNIELSAEGSAFDVVLDGEALGRLRLPVPGRHNILNALAATAVALELGLPFEQVSAGFAVMRLPRRRFERVPAPAGIAIYSDYAHHPSEIQALVRTAAAQPHERLLAIFQPHRYTRTLALGADFPPAFAGVDEVVLTPVYAASEAPLPGGETWDLYRHFRAAPGSSRPRVMCATSLQQAWAAVRRRLRPGDLLLIVGAGDVEKIAQWAAAEGVECPADSNVEVSGVQGSELSVRRSAFPPSAPSGRPAPEDRTESRTPAPPAGLPPLSGRSRVKLDEPLGAKTTMGVGGAADIWVEAGAPEDLEALLSWSHRLRVPLRILGGGSNVVVSDLGARGVTIRLAGECFRGLREEAGAVVAGAGASLAALLGWLEERGLGGLEFLEGIPGTVGGALRMNAGAHGDEIGRHVVSIRCLNSDGTKSIVPASELGAAYRRCPALAERVAVEVQLRATPAAPDAIRARRAALRAGREWMRGFRSAGSVFKNPPGDFAGRLIEAAGLKGLEVGGAAVTQRHANVIAAGEGATGSDVRALVELVRARVARETGVRLEAEVEFWG